MTKSFSKGFTKRITDRTVMIANRLVIFIKRISNALTYQKNSLVNPSIVRYK